MKRSALLFMAVFCLTLGGLALSLFARPAADPKPADPETVKVASSKIVHVTVYPDSALVTREVEVPAGTGIIELVVNPLPQHTVNSSLYSEGSEGIRVLTTRFRTRPVKEDTREEVRKLEDEIKKLQQNAQQIQADLKANDANMALLTKLESFTAASTVHATEKGKLDSKETIEMAKYVMEGRAEKSKETVKLQQQLQTNNEHLEFAQRKLRDMTAGSSKTERDAVIVVDKPNAAGGKVRLNYLVDAAAWRPQYKFRAGKKSDDPVQIEYLAAIFQQTGEDWTGVDMVLSTAQPRLNAAPPDLRMLAVAVVPKGSVPAQTAGQPGGKGQFGQFGGQGGAQFGNQPIPNPQGQASVMELNEAARQLRVQAQKEDNLKKGIDNNSNEIWNYAGALEQARDLVLLPDDMRANKLLTSRRAGGNNEGPSVTYHLKNKLSVPSRNDEQVIEVTRIEMKPDYFYKAVPVLTPHVYKQADLTNKSEHVLLPGEATMYNGTDFVGRMNLPLVAVGEEFTVGFGTEPQLQVQRQMIDKTRAAQGGNQVLNYQYRILVSSYKSEKVRLQVWDRLPTAENETMGVTLIKASPDVSKDALYLREERPNNLLRWDMTIEPAMKGEKAQAINYEFKLELDKQMTIGSFQSK